MAINYSLRSTFAQEIIGGSDQLYVAELFGRTSRFTDVFYIPPTGDWGPDSSNIVLFGPIPDHSVVTGATTFFSEKLGVQDIRIHLGWFAYNRIGTLLNSEPTVYASNLVASEKDIFTNIGYPTRTFYSPLIQSRGCVYFGATIECDGTGDIESGKNMRIELFLSTI